MDRIFLRVKFLVDQVTGQVAWLKMYPDSTPIPSVDQIKTTTVVVNP